MPDSSQVLPRYLGDKLLGGCDQLVLVLHGSQQGERLMLIDPQLMLQPHNDRADPQQEDDHDHNENNIIVLRLIFVDGGHEVVLVLIDARREDAVDGQPRPGEHCRLDEGVVGELADHV